MVARLKLKEIDGMAPQDVERAVNSDNERDLNLLNSPIDYGWWLAS